MDPLSQRHPLPSHTGFVPPIASIPWFCKTHYPQPSFVSTSDLPISDFSENLFPLSTNTIIRSSINISFSLTHLFYPNSTLLLHGTGGRLFTHDPSMYFRRVFYASPVVPPLFGPPNFLSSRVLRFFPLGQLQPQEYSISHFTTNSP